MYLIRELLAVSLVDIGRAFGGRDHSTVIHSVQKVVEMMAQDDAVRVRIDALRAEIGG
jgi:chromosomal replication initiator protein